MAVDSLCKLIQENLSTAHYLGVNTNGGSIFSTVLMES
uniref:Uncharacterized protein n=1 Tax=Anguilla anguilla TaxID=7936 RepID=A0A0E9XGX2_ANGAN